MAVTRARVTIAAGLAVAVMLLATPGRAAAHGSGYYVTFVARSCASYSDIYANKARNDIQESLQDLGPDSPYVTGDLVDPAVEESAPQSACSPLPNWTFTLGTGIETGVVGPWGSMSKVTDPFDTSVVTQDSTPLYDQYHNRIPGETLAGATTVELTHAERQAASVSGGLWAQGGVPDDPVLTAQYPGPEYGFGALRCSDDAVNGDNVEHIYFPAGVTHVFCYALYVVPPPTSGTITITKDVVDAPENSGPAFHFSGSLTYNPDGFTLADTQSADFYRAGSQTWEVSEDAVADYKLTSIDCTARTASGGPGSSSETVNGSSVAIHLVATEHVTCLYTNTYEPPTGGLTIAKITRGGVGHFGYTVTPAGGGGAHHSAAATTHPGVPAEALPALTELAPGRYTIREHSPHSSAGEWHPVKVICDGRRERPGHPVHVVVTADHSTACTFVNAFVPAGSISLAKVTEGSTGTVIFSVASRTSQYRQHATTQQEGVAVEATPNSPTDATTHLPLGLYAISEQAPPSVNGDDWTLKSVICNGRLVPFSRGAALVLLTPRTPAVHCVFTDTFSEQPTPAPQPEPPLPPQPTPPGPGPSPARTPNRIYPTADLSVVKQALNPVVHRGQAAVYRIKVHNHGPAAAAHVVVADGPDRDVRILTVHPSTGRCRVGVLVLCRLGNLEAGATATITVRLIPNTGKAHFENTAIVGSGTQDGHLRNNISRARIRIIAPPAHHRVGCPPSGGALSPDC